ncbi:DUF7507 domain-containing protein, partial [Methanocrinis sp.]|uniref:DUF7507 domain-containing protein n=1 Tax=Methanocrinis sp. TaxID=3101522 RepID=UPI003D123601
ADPEEGVPSTNVTFLINVTNTGQVNFTEVEVVDVLPYGLDKISYNRSGSVDGQNVTWILSGLNVSESKFIELVAQINSSKSGNLTNKVTATGVQPSGDKVTANDSENVTVFIPSISVNKTAYPESGSNGTRVNFTIKVTNTGNATLNPVIVTDALPEGLDYVSSTGSFNNSSNNVTWNLGTLDKSKPKMVYLEARINRSGPGILTNLVSVEGKPEFGYNATDNDSIAIPVTIPPMISVNKTAYPESGSNGTRVNFTIKVTNTGNATLNPVILTDALPEGLDYVSSTGSFDNSSNNVTWNLGTLDKSEPRVVYLIARINSSTFGDLTNFVEVEGKPMSGNNVTAKDSADVDVNNVTETLNKTDLILALDTSGSMRKYYRMAKNESAEIVSGWSGFENATISIVSWDHESEIVFGPAPLSGNETRLAEILDNLSEMCMETDLTEYDQGLNGSLAMMRDHPDGVAGSWKIIIFLTGYSEFEPGERLDDYISEANESGYRIFTIGLGINESFNASQKQYSNLTRISEGTGGEFYNVTAFSSEELNPVMYNITRVAEGDLRSTEPGF